jgi:hypothetical protein
MIFIKPIPLLHGFIVHEKCPLSSRNKIGHRKVTDFAVNAILIYYLRRQISAKFRAALPLYCGQPSKMKEHKREEDSPYEKKNTYRRHGPCPGSQLVRRVSGF